MSIYLSERLLFDALDLLSEKEISSPIAFTVLLVIRAAPQWDEILDRGYRVNVNTSPLLNKVLLRADELVDRVSQGDAHSRTLKRPAGRRHFKAR
jgi:hypothetical protein